jgi:hypothetical protein
MRKVMADRSHLNGRLCFEFARTFGNIAAHPTHIPTKDQIPSQPGGKNTFLQWWTAVSS